MSGGWQDRLAPSEDGARSGGGHGRREAMRAGWLERFTAGEIREMAGAFQTLTRDHSKFAKDKRKEMAA